MAVVARAKTQKRLAMSVSKIPNSKRSEGGDYRQNCHRYGITMVDRGPDILPVNHFNADICRSKMENAFWWESTDGYSEEE